MPAIFVYSTVFPGVEPYLADWYSSVMAQTQSDFTLCIGQDDLSRDAVSRHAGQRVEAEWFMAPTGSTIADVRNAALAEIARYEGIVVMVDSDDVLLSNRVANARQMLLDCDVAACALELASQDGTRTGEVITVRESTKPDDILPRHNLFGLSNSAWRMGMLRRCLPVPSEALLVDWYLVTQAWLYGGVLKFDRRIGMLYRQHDRSSAQIRPPFTPHQVRNDTEKVYQHFALVCANFRAGQNESRQKRLAGVADDVGRFREIVCSDAQLLDEYVRRLNHTQCGNFWWESVAYPELRALWC